MSEHKRGWLLPVVAVLVLLLMVAFMAGYFNDKIEPDLDAAVPADETGAVPARLEEAPLTEPVPASVEAKETTVISSRLLAELPSTRGLF